LEKLDVDGSALRNYTLRKINGESVNWIHLAQDKEKMAVT
jgi:hypothetical protein